jgi:ATP-dependent DNA ligase
MLWPQPPGAGKWVHEIKFDGYRVQLDRSDAGIPVLHPTRQ